MKKFTSIFLVLVIVSSFIGCGTISNGETATTTLETVLSIETTEVMQWVICNIASKQSATRFVRVSLYDEVSKEIEKYVRSLPFSVNIYIETPSFADDFFEITIKF